MWAMTKNLAQETRVQGHPAAKVALVVLTAVVALCTVSWFALKLLAELVMSMLKIANDGLYAVLRQIHLRPAGPTGLESADSGSELTPLEESKRLPSGLRWDQYHSFDSRCVCDDDD